MRKLVPIAALVLAAGGVAHNARTVAATQAMPTPQQQLPPAPGAPAATDDLTDLDAMTFGCSKAGLNAAAREAAKVQSQGTYQFSYFRIVNDAHHAMYEVRFKSNYAGEPDLNYCVALYCQQGWDPRTTRAAVSLMAPPPQRGKGAAPATRAPHAAANPAAMCSAEPAPAQRRRK